VKQVFDAVLPFSMLYGSVSALGKNGNLDDQLNRSNGDISDPPPSIDNFAIVRKRQALRGVLSFLDNDTSKKYTITTSPILHPGLELGTHVELIPPDAFRALFLWYGGGPQVM
jgi:hypothetical protein